MCFLTVMKLPFHRTIVQCVVSCETAWIRSISDAPASGDVKNTHCTTRPETRSSLPKRIWDKQQSQINKDNGVEEDNRDHREEDSHEEVEEDSRDHQEGDKRQEEDTRREEDSHPEEDKHLVVVEEGFLGLRMNAERLNYRPPSG